MSDDRLLNGREVNHLLADAHAREQAQREAQRHLIAALEGALREPIVTRRANVSAVTIENRADERVLLVGLPTGERWDVPLSPPSVAYLLQMLADPEPVLEGRDEKVAASGGGVEVGPDGNKWHAEGAGPEQAAA